MVSDAGGAKKRAVKLEGGPHDGELVDVEQESLSIDLDGERYVCVADDVFAYRSPHRSEPPPTRAIMRIGNSMTDTLTRILARLDTDETDPSIAPVDPTKA